MLKRDITYETYEDEPKTVTETFYFNLSKAELVELEAKDKDSFSSVLQSIVDAKSVEGMTQQFKGFILMSYGERTADGKGFTKVDDDDKKLSAKFYQTAAYSALFTELMSDDNKAADFMFGIFPKDFVDQAQFELDKLKADAEKQKQAQKSTAEIAAELEAKRAKELEGLKSADIPETI